MAENEENVKNALNKKIEEMKKDAISHGDIAKDSKGYYKYDQMDFEIVISSFKDEKLNLDKY
jgi:demethoxyubiquinone hydroxylase (CLK1/Coq7/Cat5 family)